MQGLRKKRIWVWFLSMLPLFFDLFFLNRYLVEVKHSFKMDGQLYCSCTLGPNKLNMLGKKKNDILKWDRCSFFNYNSMNIAQRLLPYRQSSSHWHTFPWNSSSFYLLLKTTYAYKLSQSISSWGAWLSCHPRHQPFEASTGLLGTTQTNPRRLVL